MTFNLQHKPLLSRLFDDGIELVDGVEDIFELELALLEYETLTRSELHKRSAFIGKIDNVETLHVQTCNRQNLEQIHQNSSFRTKVFFLNGKYSTGYATHSLFPYRGKFHPQFLRGLMNIMDLSPGSIVMDPMAGSSTLAVEANLLGIDAISLDVSPFCQLMGRVKTFSLNLEYEQLSSIAQNVDKIFKKLNERKIQFDPKIGFSEVSNNYYEIILLAYLDAMGFSSRSKKSLETLFPRVLDRYLLTIKYFQEARKSLSLDIGKSEILLGSALDMPVNDSSIDAIITSPPYSFAIDYLQNDKPQLEYLGINLNDLRNDMIGLKGRGIEEKLQIYFEQMQAVFAEIVRVSKPGSPVVIIVGNNTVQTKGVLLDERLITISEGEGLQFETLMKKPIRGLQNSMKDESILFFTNRKELHVTDNPNDRR